MIAKPVDERISPERAETPAKIDESRRRQRLIAEKDDEMREQCVTNGGDGVVAKRLRQFDTSDFRTEATDQRGDRYG